MSAGEAENIVITADVSGYTQAMQEGYSQTSRLNEVLGQTVVAIDNLHQKAQRRFELVDAAAVAGVTTAAAAAASLNEQMQRLETQARGSGRSFGEATQSVSRLRREFGMATDAATSLMTQMSKIGKMTPTQAQQQSSSYVGLAGMTGESVSGLMSSQTNFARQINQGRLPQNIDRYSSMTGILANTNGTSALGILDHANSLAPVARTVGINASQTMGLSTAFSRAGTDGDHASSAVTQLLSQLERARRDGSPVLGQMASFMGVSTGDLKNMSGTNAAVNLMERVGSSGATGARFLDSMGLNGTQTQMAIQSTLNTGDLRGTIQQAQGAYQNTSSFKNQSEQSLDTLSNAVNKNIEVYKGAAEAIGSLFTPALKGAAEATSLLLAPVKGLTDVLNKVTGNDTVKGVAGFAGSAAVYSMALPRIAKMGLGAAGVSEVARGGFSRGFRLARDPNKGLNSDEKMLLEGEGTAFQNSAFGVGARLGLWLPGGKEASSDRGRKQSEALRKLVGADNPVDSAKSKASEETNDAAKETKERRRDDERAERAAKKQAETAAKISRTTDAAQSASLDAAMRSTKDATEAIKKQADAPKSAEPRRGWKDAAKTGVVGAGNFIESMYDAGARPRTHQQRAKSESIAPFPTWRENFDYLAYSVGGYDRERGPRKGVSWATDRFLHKEGRDINEYGAKLKAYKDSIPEVERGKVNPKHGLGRTILGTGARVGGTALASTARTGMGALSALGGLAGGVGGILSGLMTPALAIGLVGAGAAHIYGTKQESDAKIDYIGSAGVSQNNMYREALGEATTAVKTFAEAAKDAASRIKSGTGMDADGTLTTEFKTDIRANKADYKNPDSLLSRAIEANDGKPLTGKELDAYIDTVTSKYDSREVKGLIQVEAAANDMLDVNFERKLQERYKQLESLTGVTTDTGQMTAGINEELLRESSINMADRIGHANSLGGQYAAYAQSLTEIENFAEGITSRMSNKGVWWTNYNENNELLATGKSAAGVSGEAQEKLYSAAATAVRDGMAWNDELAEIVRKEFADDKDFRVIDTLFGGDRIQLGSAKARERLMEAVMKEIAAQNYPGVNPEGLSIEEMDTPNLQLSYLDKAGLIDISQYGNYTSSQAGTPRTTRFGKLIAGEDGNTRAMQSLASPGSAGTRTIAAMQMTDDMTQTGVIPSYTAAISDIQRSMIAAPENEGLQALGAESISRMTQRMQAQQRYEGHHPLLNPEPTMQQYTATRAMLVRNPESPVANQAFLQSEQAMLGYADQADSFIRSLYGNVRSMELSEKFQRENFNIGYQQAKETKDIHQGWQTSDYWRSRRWQDEALERQMGYQSHDFYQSRRWQQEDFDISRGRAREDFARQQGYQLVDYQRQRGYQLEDFGISRSRAVEDYNRSRGYQLEDFYRQRGYQEEDFNISRARAEEDYTRQRKYQEEDYQKSRRRQEEDFDISRRRRDRDYDRSRARQLEDYNRSRAREEEDWNHRLEMMAKQSAQNIYNIYDRIAVARTWSIEGLVANMADQQEALNKQLANLDSLREWGVSDEVIQTLGLGETANAQQLERMVAEMGSGQTTAADLNAAIAERIGAANSLLTDESNLQWEEMQYQREKGLARQEEDFRLSRDRQQEDYNISTRDMFEDFDRQRARQEEDYGIHLLRQEEQFRLSMGRQLEDYRRSMQRAEEEFKIHRKRQEEEFQRSLARQEEDLNRSMARMEYEFKLHRARTEEEFERSLARSEEDFRRSNDRALTMFEQQRDRMLKEYAITNKQSETMFKESIDRTNSEFERQYKVQWENMNRSFRQNREALSDQIEALSVGTETAYKKVFENTSGAARDNLNTIKKFYDDVRKAVEGIDSAIGATLNDLQLGRPADWSTGVKGREKDPSLNKRGGPEHGSDSGVAALLGSHVNPTAQGGAAEMPTSGPTTQRFSTAHPGIDIAGKAGDPIKAHMNGVVAYTGNVGAYGLLTKIKHGSGLETWYAHQQIANVREGDAVTAGQVIGKIGSTGNVYPKGDAGAHLHWEVRLDGKPVDPGSAGELASGGIGGPNIDKELEKLKKNSAWKKYDDVVHRSAALGKIIPRNATRDHWLDRIEQEYQQKLMEEMAAMYGGYFFSDGITVRPVPQGHSGWNGGRYRSGKWHGGLDFPAPRGTPIRAPWSGQVDTVKHLNRSYGYHVWLSHGDKRSLYAHMSKINVKKGDHVSAGHVLGLVGSTGNSTGNHLHWEVRVNGKQVDPSKYLSGAITDLKNLPKTSVKGKWGSNVERWRPTVQQALRLLGQPLTYTDLSLRRLNQESGGNPRAINLWDSNAKKGIPSKGLMQVIDPTFRSFRDPRLPNNIWDPLANIAAGMRWSIHRWGSIPAGFNRKGGYAGGTNSADPGVKEVAEHGIELVIGRGLRRFLGGEKVLNPVQTRQAFNKGMQGVPPQQLQPTSNHIDRSIKVEKVVVQANNPDEFRNAMEDRRRLTAMARGR